MAEINKQKAVPKIPSRIDLQIEITPLSFDEMSRTKPGESSSVIREHVIRRYRRNVSRTTEASIVMPR